MWIFVFAQRYADSTHDHSSVHTASSSQRTDSQQNSSSRRQFKTQLCEPGHLLNSAKAQKRKSQLQAAQLSCTCTAPPLEIHSDRCSETLGRYNEFTAGLAESNPLLCRVLTGAMVRMLGLSPFTSTGRKNLCSFILYFVIGWYLWQRMMARNFYHEAPRPMVDPYARALAAGHSPKVCGLTLVLAWPPDEVGNPL